MQVKKEVETNLHIKSWYMISSQWKVAKFVESTMANPNILISFLL